METEVCNNCNRNIPSVNYVIHQAHCSRNVVICSECNEPVRKVDSQSHREQYHRTISCALCGNQVVPARLQDHLENSCLERMVECDFCCLQLRIRKLNKHEVYCGSRTEACERCRKYVMIKDVQGHVCVDSQPLKSSSSSRSDVTIAPVIVIDDDDTDNRSINGQTDSHKMTNHSQTRPELSTAEAQDGCHGNDSIYALPCEVCGELCASDRLMDHQEQCGVMEVEGQYQDGDVERHSGTMYLGDRGTQPYGRTPFDVPDPFGMLIQSHPFFDGSIFDRILANRFRTDI